MSIRRVLVFAALLAAGCGPAKPPARPAPKEGDLDWTVPGFTLTERNGKEVSPSDLRGKAWVASFVFTRCTGPCPSVTATMAKIQAATKDVPDIRLVTFTIDPERDTPDELKKYADRYGADPDRWLFLTGGEGDLHRLSTIGFKMLAEHKENPKPGDEFDHSTRLAVVDKWGVIRAVFDGTAAGGAAAPIEPIVAKLTELAKE